MNPPFSSAQNALEHFAARGVVICVEPATESKSGQLFHFKRLTTTRGVLLPGDFQRLRPFRAAIIKLIETGRGVPAVEVAPAAPRPSLPERRLVYREAVIAPDTVISPRRDAGTSVARTRVRPSRAMSDNANRRGSTPALDWNAVDWSKSNRELANEAGLCLSTFNKRRPREHSNHRPKVDWKPVDWTKTTGKIAEELGVTRRSVNWNRPK